MSLQFATGGWINDPQAVDQYLGTLPNLSLAHVLAADDDGDKLLWDAEIEVTGTVRPPHKQTTNDCVSHGVSGVLEDTQFVNIAWRGLGGKYFNVASEPIYGGAIVNIGHQKGDNGAVVGWGTDFVQKYGIPPRTKIGRFDFSVYNGKVATQFSNSGVPQDLADLLTQKVKAIVNVKSFTDAAALIRQGYGIVGGSNQGFSLKRDVDGFCHAEGQWAHCTYFRAVRGGRRPGIGYQQSWGPGMPSGNATVHLDKSGRDLTLPEGFFFVEPKVFNNMCSSGYGEMYAISLADNFYPLDAKFWK